ncbi:hypothetical protein LRS73_28120 [Methylobacterium currus]|uniref:hypothetical protein n=1 Tax=Methylobacterium currus TaxID=2051553 RepID=UPI001E42858E|nr:hypothetical protein [Methylobacterium currus]UHC16278.1 hypothetical protein LRS73_28120 [Methylobacterium currus]
MRPAKILRPPSRSDRTPRNSPDTEPDRIGVPTRSPDCVLDKLGSSLIPMPRMEKIVQTAKLAVNAAVLVQRTRSACSAVPLGEVTNVATGGSPVRRMSKGRVTQRVRTILR